MLNANWTGVGHIDLADGWMIRTEWRAAQRRFLATVVDGRGDIAFRFNCRNLDFAIAEATRLAAGEASDATPSDAPRRAEAA